MKVTGPLTIACAVFGAERILLGTLEEPDAVKHVLEVATRAAIELSRAAIKAGVDTITISDPVASGDLLSADQYAEFAPTVRGQGVRRHQRPDRAAHLRLHQGPDAAHCVDRHHGVLVRGKGRGEGRQAVLGKVRAIGNVAPVRALLNGGPDDVLREANKCFEDGVDLLSSGCAVPPLTQLENLRAMAAAGAG